LSCSHLAKTRKGPLQAVIAPLKGEMTSPPPNPQFTVVAEPVPLAAVPRAPSAPPASQAQKHVPQQHINQVFNQALRPQQPQQQQPQTHIEVKIAVPEGTVPGQQVFCTLPDGRRATVVAEEHLEPGSSMAVRFPSQLPSQQPQPQPQQNNLQPPPLAAQLLSPLPETEVAPDDGQAATRYWWVYGLSWLACCVAPWMGACMMFGMTVHYFCFKTAQERARRPRQSLPAKVAAATLGAKCICVAVFFFAGSILYIACGHSNDLDKCPGLSVYFHRLHPGHHHPHWPHHGHADDDEDGDNGDDDDDAEGDDDGDDEDGDHVRPGHHQWHQHELGDHDHTGHHHWHHHEHGDRNHPGFDVPPYGNPLPKCQACLASGFDYCIREDRCTKRATYTCRGPRDHITGDEEFALHGNPRTQHSMTCPGSEVKATIGFSAMAESKDSAVKSLLGTQHADPAGAAEKTASMVV